MDASRSRVRRWVGVAVLGPVLALVASVSPCDAGRVEVADRTGVLTSPDELPPVGRHGASLRLDVPHLRQEPDLCVPTSAAMVLAYYGDPHPPRELKVLSRRKVYDPAEPFDDFTFTWWPDLVAGLKPLGHFWKDTTYPNDERGFRAGVQDIFASLRRDEPVLVDVALYRSHTLVIVGYDEEQGLVFIRDPNLPAPGFRVLTLDQLESIWNGLSYGTDARPALFTRRPKQKRR